MSKKEVRAGVQILTVDADREGQRIDNFLMAQLKGVPRSAVYRMIRTGQVRVNGGRCKAARRLAAGDRVRVPPVRRNESSGIVLPRGVRSAVSEAILFENEDVLVVDKPAGMAVHSGSGLAWGLIDVIRELRPDHRVELLHRLDRETSGCLVLARNRDALATISAQFRSGAAEKKYLCLLDGHMKQDCIEVDAPLAKVSEGQRRLVRVEGGGKPALTRFRLLRRFSDCSYAEAELMSGRTHQIRVHAQFLGTALAGDERYADRESLRKWSRRGLRRMFLHAHHLALRLPSGEQVTFDAPLPADLRALLDGLEPR
jgi:23S rRNA pseudouridine955/2504/2580 synthase